MIGSKKEREGRGGEVSGIYTTSDKSSMADEVGDNEHRHIATHCQSIQGGQRKQILTDKHCPKV